VVEEQNRTASVAPARVLVVGDDPGAASVMADMVRDLWPGSLVVEHREPLGHADEELLDHGTTCVLLHLGQPEGDRLAPLRQLRATARDVPIIVLCDDASDEFGLRALNAGAQDCLSTTELEPAVLGRAVRYAIERKRSEVELAHQALHDPLTGLPNRVLFLDRLAVALHRLRRTSASLTVMFLDVDTFKATNDSLGHSAGDQVLIGLADRLQALLRPMDTMARFGGDEFIFLFEDLESEREAVLIVERLNRTASLPITLDGKELSITVSIGIATALDSAIAPDDLIRDADSAMYRAKRQGGAGFELFDDASRRRATERLELERALRQAVERSELRVHYQPRVSLDGEMRLVGFEALVRWEHPLRGLIPPEEFIAVAQDTGLIVPIGQYVLGEAVRTIEGWRRSRPGLTIAVNISSRELEDPGLVRTLCGALNASGADPSVLCLEVTEATIEGNRELATTTLNELRATGVRLAIDDFGIGYSSLSNLKQLPLDTLNLHESFIGRLGREPSGAAIVGAVIELGHAMGLTVVAEGVETNSQLAQLRHLSCDGAQGFLFSPPVPEDEVDALLGSPAWPPPPEDHARSANPDPRTVRITGGTPNLRRKRVT
jgi:diguanylate cyclase (GGDEF)-like protein